jgi:tetrapyrrole methylase family protein/MazG family protein
MTGEKDKNRAGFDELVELMARLRSPEGCPWDLKQTPESLTPYIIEEAYELVEAIREGDRSHICEELGDLLFQIVFQAQLASENGEFDIRDVTAKIHEKMTRRHPHVFGDSEVEDADEVRKNWVRIKEAEGKHARESALGGVPRSLPALLRSRRLTENAAEVGFDWPRLEDVLEKFDEEWAELKAGIEGGSREEVEAEFGDVLFVLVNLSRFLNLDPERSLSGTIEKFVRRFQYIEKRVMESGKKMEQVTLEEMDGYWEEAKGKGM